MLTVHHLNNSRSQRVLWLLEELGVPYEVKRYERDPKTMLAPPELRAVHPLGKSPEGRQSRGDYYERIRRPVVIPGFGRCLLRAADKADGRKGLIEAVGMTSLWNRKLTHCSITG